MCLSQTPEAPHFWRGIIEFWLLEEPWIGGIRNQIFAAFDTLLVPSGWPNYMIWN